MNAKFERTQAIVEELRADIDFELDDVIAKIVHGLPEDYFTSLSSSDQLKPLKALLAMGICHLDDEIMMRSDDGRKMAVVANSNYPGQLSDILKRLPENISLIGAKIFTSTDHDFIIDVFDFESADSDDNQISPVDRQHLIEEVMAATGKSQDEIVEYLSHYPANSPALHSASRVIEQFLAYEDIEHSSDTSIRWAESKDQRRTRVTISAGSATARQLFQCTAEYLGQQRMDIEQAWLHDIPLDPELKTHVAIASFLIDGTFKSEIDSLRQFVGQRLA